MLDLRWEPRATPWTLSVFLIFCLFACFKVTWLSCKKHNCRCIQRIHNSLPLSIFIPPLPRVSLQLIPLSFWHSSSTPVLGGAVYSQAKLLYNLFIKGHKLLWSAPSIHTHTRSRNTERLFKHECVSLPTQIPLCIRARAHTHAHTNYMLHVLYAKVQVCACVCLGRGKFNFILAFLLLEFGCFFSVAAYGRMHLSFLMLYKSLKFVKVVCILILLVVCILNWNVRWEEDAGLCEDSWDIFLSLFWDDRITTPRIQVELVLPLHHLSCAIYKIVEITWCMLPKALSLTLINRHDVSSVHIWCKYPTYMRRTRRKQPTLSE